MIKKILTLLAAACVLASCSQKSKEYVIHGTVTNPELEGAQMFLVPMTDISSETVDSVVIRNLKFEFRGTEEKMAELRVEKLKRMGMENLLVVTEPGDINVTIGAVSSGMGTVQNDSLQVWKNLTMQFNNQFNNLLRQNKVSEAQALRETYRIRSRELAANMGENSTLGAFLRGLFPEAK